MSVFSIISDMGKKVNSFMKVFVSSFLGVLVLLLSGYYLYLVLSDSRRKSSKGSKKTVSPRLNERKKNDRLVNPGADSAKMDPDGVVAHEVKPRIQKILEILDHRRPMSVPDLRRRFPGVTDRTLRRDMNEMVMKGYVLRKGTTKSTVYFKK